MLTLVQRQNAFLKLPKSYMWNFWCSAYAAPVIHEWLLISPARQPTMWFHRPAVQCWSSEVDLRWTSERNSERGRDSFGSVFLLSTALFAILSQQFRSTIQVNHPAIVLRRRRRSLGCGTGLASASTCRPGLPARKPFPHRDLAFLTRPIFMTSLFFLTRIALSLGHRRTRKAQPDAPGTTSATTGSLEVRVWEHDVAHCLKS